MECHSMGRKGILLQLQIQPWVWTCLWVCRNRAFNFNQESRMSALFQRARAPGEDLVLGMESKWNWVPKALCREWSWSEGRPCSQPRSLYAAVENRTQTCPCFSFRLKKWAYWPLVPWTHHSLQQVYGSPHTQSLSCVPMQKSWWSCPWPLLGSGTSLWGKGFSPISQGLFFQIPLSAKGEGGPRGSPPASPHRKPWFIRTATKKESSQGLGSPSSVINPDIPLGEQGRLFHKCQQDKLLVCQLLTDSDTQAPVLPHIWESGRQLLPLRDTAPVSSWCGEGGVRLSQLPHWSSPRQSIHTMPVPSLSYLVFRGQRGIIT